MTICLRSAIFGVVMLAAIAGGCKKKAAPETPPANPQARARSSTEFARTPYPEQVRSFMEKKDFREAVCALIQINQSASNEQTRIEFQNLKREMETGLQGFARTDPKAGEALKALQFMTGTN